MALVGRRIRLVGSRPLPQKDRHADAELADRAAPVRARGPVGAGRSRRRCRRADGRVRAVRRRRRVAVRELDRGRGQGRDHDRLQPAEERQVLPQGRRQSRRHGRLPRPDVPPHGDAAAIRFRDVPRHGSKATAIDKVVTAGIAAGCSKRRFCPDAAVTRGRMAVFVTRALKLTATSGVRFDDVSTHHRFATAINRLATAGLAISCGSHRFCPNRDIAAPRPPASSSAPGPSPESPRRNRRRAIRTAARRCRPAPEPPIRRRPIT